MASRILCMNCLELDELNYKSKVYSLDFVSKILVDLTWIFLRRMNEVKKALEEMEKWWHPENRIVCLANLRRSSNIIRICSSNIKSSSVISATFSNLINPFIRLHAITFTYSRLTRAITLLFHVCWEIKMTIIQRVSAVLDRRVRKCWVKQS